MTNMSFLPSGSDRVRVWNGRTPGGSGAELREERVDVDGLVER